MIMRYDVYYLLTYYLKLIVHGHGARASHGVPVYLPAYQLILLGDRDTYT